MRDVLRPAFIGRQAYEDACRGAPLIGQAVHHLARQLRSNEPVREIFAAMPIMETFGRSFRSQGAHMMQLAMRAGAARIVSRSSAFSMRHAYAPFRRQRIMIRLTVWHFVLAVLIAPGMLGCGRPLEMRDKPRPAPRETVAPMPAPPSSAGSPAHASAEPPSPAAPPADASPLPSSAPAASAVPSQPRPASPRLATVEGDRITTAKPIVFKPNDTIVLPESAPVLDAVADVLLSNPTLRVEIRVHVDITDDTNQYGRKPTEYRAQHVMRYLINRGVEPDRLTAKGYGPTQPLTRGKTPRERAQNRRTEFVIQRVP